MVRQRVLDARRRATRIQQASRVKVRAAPGISLDCGWLWSHVSPWLPLRGGERTRLRCLCRISAEAVLESLEAEACLERLFNEQIFGGLLDELRRLTTVDAPNADCDLPSPTLGRIASGVKRLSESKIFAWVQLAQRFVLQPYYSTLCGALCLFSSSGVAATSAGDITEQIRALPLGTLIWLTGRLAISNCFNSLVQPGRNMDGPWILRKSCKKRIVLERFGMPSSIEILDDYRRLLGGCFLPPVAASWACIVHVDKGSDERSGAGAAAVAEVLRVGQDADEAEEGDPIERVPISPLLAAAAQSALAAEEAPEEVLLLRWSVAGMSPLPVRVVIYGMADDPGLSPPASPYIVDEVPITSHPHLLLPPPTAPGLGALSA
eukprot:TRINITY_DN27833_c0_g1_i1.p1 TRINITY_DN27833_c0_g1~~TRINITY_DN27833_c0_g1_i1.p1  ORF type:complete len:378 (-),score=55.19 TRINITY_DN27833_c0_g1_i1:58-1191(-)